LVLPGNFPNLLANGAAGIAVGMATSIPPHNAGELCAGAILLIQRPEATTTDLLRFMPGPDFPTGGELVEDSASLLQSYETGRGGFRLRARWAVEQGKHGTWVIVVNEIPYQVQKSRLIEQIAQMMEEKKLPLLADIRDESTDKVRLVLEPKARTVEPAMLMESLFRVSALETRFPLNMNVLDAMRTPRVMPLREVLRAWLDHRQDVLARRSRHRLAAIERRLEILDGYLTVFLNLDEVIKIIREQDEPKPVLMKRFELTDVQAEAILNMRLRSLRRLEEIELRKEHKSLTKEAKDLRMLLSSEKLRWEKIVTELEKTRATFGSGALGDRRTLIGSAPTIIAIDEAALVEREAITVILSEKGWIRAVKGQVSNDADLRFKDGDSLRLTLPCDTTDRLCLLATNGRAYTIKANDIPRGRGDGQPIRLIAEFGNEDEVVGLFAWTAGASYLLASTPGRGFVVRADDLLSERRAGKQVMTVKAGEELALAVPVGDGDHLAVVGENRKMLVFPLVEVPEMARGTGVQLQRYKDGGIADARVFKLAEGLSWKSGERIRTETNLKEWLGSRAQTGRQPPVGFPKAGRFGA
jgi:topoisomerase-4 subunit A